MARTILVIDDQAIIREPVAAVLRAHGYQTATATNGQEALLALSTARPDLVLLDLGMPVMDGLAVLNRMRMDSALCSVPVIVLSAEADRERITEAVKLGISGYVLKATFSLKDVMLRVNAQFAGTSHSPATAGEQRPRSATVESPPCEAAPSGATGEAAAPARPKPAGPSLAPATPVIPAVREGGLRELAADLKSLKPLLSRADLLERLKACDELKGFSPTVSQVLKLTSTADYSLDSISKAVRQDQAMALKILKIANSSIYSRGDRVDTVNKAILRIGMESIRQVVLNIGVVERFSSMAFQGHLSTPQFWEHSIACGIIASQIAQAQSAKEADSAFTSGLLHDLGRVVLAEVLGELYIQVIETARRLEVPLELAESRLLPLNHADVMDRLLNAWKFPKHLVDPIVLHHAPAAKVRSAAPTRVPEILRLGLANRLAHAMLLGNSGNEIIYPTQEHCKSLDIPAATIRSVEETARQQTDDTKISLLSATSSTAWPRRSAEIKGMLNAPLRPLFVSLTPEVDAYRIFCAELASSSTSEPPNIAVVHIASPKEIVPLAERLAAAEAQEGLKELPLLMLSPAGQLALNDSALAARRSRRLGTPMPVSQFTSAVNELLSSGAARQAA